jgi:hypothetical protein
LVGAESEHLTERVLIFTRHEQPTAEPFLEYLHARVCIGVSDIELLRVCSAAFQLVKASAAGVYVEAHRPGRKSPPSAA